MIDISTRVHDRDSIEFKIGYVTDKDVRQEDFLLGMWIFWPGGLDITSSTFSKNAFYRYFKSNVRLITPHFPLGQIVGGDAVPLKNILSADEGLDYRLRLFGSIVKSSLRDGCDKILSAEADERTELCKTYASDALDILKRYDSLEVPRQYVDEYRICGEFICNVTAASMFRLVDNGLACPEISSVLYKVRDIREAMGYARVKPGDAEANKEFISRQGLVKKHVEGPLFLKAPKIRDGFLAEQAYYSIAAGLAMLFATVVAWAFQRQFGNLTWPLFIALIISYMLKDRIKELTRYYFSHKVGSKYFDNKADIRYKDTKLGELKEGMDFVKRDKIPREVMDLRLGGSKTDIPEAGESTLLYRKKLHIDRDALDRISIYEHEGINDIIRLHFEGFLKKADNAVSYVGYLGEDGEVIKVPCERDYCIHIVFQYDYEGSRDLKLFRVYINRDGIKEIEEVR